MKNESFEVRHRGIVIKISPTVTVKKDVRYPAWQFTDYSNGRRERPNFADRQEAITEAKKLAEKISAEGGLMEGLALQRTVQVALERLCPTGLRLDHAVSIVAQACEIIPVNEIIAACVAWRDGRPDKNIKKVTVNDGIKEFSAQHRASATRKENVNNYLMTFAKKFGARFIDEIKPADIETWLIEGQWANKTSNDYLQAVSQFMKFAVRRNWTVENPAAEIKRLRVPNRPVCIYTPNEIRQQLDGLCRSAPELAVAAAIGCFAGLRISEISRLRWEQLNAALESGFIEVDGRDTKTGESRNVKLESNLKEWLLAYRKTSGPVLPSYWMQPTKRHQNRLCELGRYIASKTKTVWKSNGWRHTFGTLHLKRDGDPHATILAMGTSLIKLQKHYMSKAQIVTKAAALEWFTTAPVAESNVVPLPAPVSVLEAAVV